MAQVSLQGTSFAFVLTSQAAAGGKHSNLTQGWDAVHLFELPMEDDEEQNWESFLVILRRLAQV